MTKTGKKNAPQDVSPAARNTFSLFLMSELFLHIEADTHTIIVLADVADRAKRRVA